LEAVDGQAIEMIPITPEAGISTIAFALKEPLDGYSKVTAELSMDSTCGSLSIKFWSRSLPLSRENKCCGIQVVWIFWGGKWAVTASWIHLHYND
jgi:hypothetical protein